MVIKWLGHSCFKITDLGQSVIFDPFCDNSVAGYRNIREEANLVLCSHMHGDHSGTSCVKLLESAHQVFNVDYINSYHDDKKGQLRGENIIHVVWDDGFKFAHLGDLGCDLTDEQYQKLQDLDVLMIPVGGYYTIDGKKAAAIAKRINPKVIIPMHYHDKELGYDVLSDVFAFTKYFEKVTYLTTDTLEFSDELSGEVIVFDYQK